MSYGLEEFVQFRVRMGKNLNGWSAVVDIDHPRNQFPVGAFGANLSFREALQQATENVEATLRLLIRQGIWPTFLNTNDPTDVPADVDRSKVLGRFDDAPASAQEPAP